jgi:hypothetical protein
VNPSSRAGTEDRLNAIGRSGGPAALTQPGARSARIGHEGGEDRLGGPPAAERDDGTPVGRRGNIADTSQALGEPAEMALDDGIMRESILMSRYLAMIRHIWVC